MERQEHVARAVRPDTGLVVAETPGNPTLELVDLAADAGLARDAAREALQSGGYLAAVRADQAQAAADALAAQNQAEQAALALETERAELQRQAAELAARPEHLERWRRLHRESAGSPVAWCTANDRRICGSQDHISLTCDGYSTKSRGTSVPDWDG